MDHATFLGLSPEAWTAIATTGLAFLTAILVGVGAWQVAELQSQNKKSRTLVVCEKYDLDPVLDVCIRNLATATRNGAFAAHPAHYKTDISTLLNYLDSIAIGIEQGLYIDELAKDHLSVIVKKHVGAYIDDAAQARAIGIDAGNFRRLRSLAERWSHDPTSYRDGPWFWKRRKQP